MRDYIDLLHTTWLVHRENQSSSFVMSQKKVQIIFADCVCVKMQYANLNPVPQLKCQDFNLGLRLHFSIKPGIDILLLIYTTLLR